jgi:hypothetical protein
LADSRVFEEREWRELLATRESAAVEVATPAGFIDVLSDTAVYEIKHYRGWKSALGQVLAYSYYYPTKTRKLFLYGESESDDREMISTICARHWVQVEWAELLFDFLSEEDRKRMVSNVRAIAEKKAELSDLKRDQEAAQQRELQVHLDAIEKARVAMAILAANLEGFEAVIDHDNELRLWRALSQMLRNGAEAIDYFIGDAKPRLAA